MGEFSVSSDICTFLNRKHALHHDIHCKWQHNQQHVGCYQQQSSPETFSSGLQVVAPPRFHGCLIVSVSNERLYPKVLQCEAHYRSRYDLTLYTHCQIHITHVWCTVGRGNNNLNYQYHKHRDWPATSQTHQCDQWVALDLCLDAGALLFWPLPRDHFASWDPCRS